MGGLYVLTDTNIPIQVNPHIRIPRTFKRFCGFMVKLLQKLSIRATNVQKSCWELLNNRLRSIFQLEDGGLETSYSAPKVIKLHDYVVSMGTKAKLVFVVEAMAHGKIKTDYIEDMIVVSKCSMLHWLYLQCHWVTIQYFVNCYSLALFPADNEGMAIEWKKLHGGRERERHTETGDPLSLKKMVFEHSLALHILSLYYPWNLFMLKPHQFLCTI